MILVVDLASKMSAACVMDGDGKVHRQFDSYNKTVFQFVKELRKAADDFKVSLIIVEDTPYGISNQAMVKPVLRLQGILIALLNPYLDSLLFLNPSTWQKRYPGVGTAPKGLTKAQKDAFRIEAARKAAEDLGYAPPDLVAEYELLAKAEGKKILKKDTNPLAKVMTDYVDAFLMARWVLSFDTEEELRSQTGLQPVMI